VALLLVKPDVDEADIARCLEAEYALPVGSVAFLPLGADVDAAAYRAEATGGRAYFVKLRRGTFDDVAVALPRCLRDVGIRQVMAPLPGRSGRLWVRLGEFALIVYPFVDGRDAYGTALSDGQCVELGAALWQVHTATIPADLKARMRREAYSRRWRDAVVEFVTRADDAAAVDGVAAAVLALLRQRRGELLDLVARTAALAAVLHGRPRADTVCHADLHAGNVLLTADGTLYLVDWDAPILAPRERDLMYAGGGLLGAWRSPEDEEALFYQGYGPVAVDVVALAYYRYERVIQDVAAYCEQLLLSAEGGADREQSLLYLRSSFQPGGVLEVARRSDRAR
jgi:spectinomycin phosphotransferase